MDLPPPQMIEWIERTIGGRVIRCERQPRWRPAWFVDVDRDGDILPVYFRGDRGSLDHGVYTLEHEFRILAVLEAHDIAVPHVYGFCPDPRGIVMARVPGRANLLTVDDPTERAEILNDYMTWLARIHRIGTGPFQAAGLTMAESAMIMADFDRWESTYRAKKARPEPFLEFAIGWLRRNAPARHAEPTLAVGDSGQFLFADRRVSAVIDLELAFLGDPLHDLACMRLRDLAEPLGPLAPAFAHYEAEMGTPIDRAALDFHTVRFAVCTPMSVSHVLAQPPGDIDLVRYLVWYVQFSRVALEIMADLEGITLDAPIALQAEATRFVDGFAMLDAALADLSPDEPQQQFRLDVAQRLSAFLRRVNEVGPQIESDDLDEIAELLGTRPTSWRDGDAALESFVAKADDAYDAELIRYFHRRMSRWQQLVEIGMRNRSYSAQPLD
ncbi:MAG: phosphotransferase family protein [Acidimicrobiales bacterium]